MSRLRPRLTQSPRLSKIYKYCDSSHNLLRTFNVLAIEEQKKLATTRLSEVSRIHSQITEHSTAQIIYLNYQEIDDTVYTEDHYYRLFDVSYKWMDTISNDSSYLTNKYPEMIKELSQF